MLIPLWAEEVVECNGDSDGNDGSVGAAELGDNRGISERERRTVAGVAEALIGRRWNLGASFLFWSFSGAPRGRFHFIPVCAAHSGGIAGQQPASNWVLPPWTSRPTVMEAPEKPRCTHCTETHGGPPCRQNKRHTKSLEPHNRDERLEEIGFFSEQPDSQSLLQCL